MNEKLKDYAPLGIDLNQEIKWITYALTASILFSFKYLFDLGNRYDDLYTYVHQNRVLIKGILMPDYVDILGNSLIGFFVVSLAAIALLVYHYLYHYHGAKSIYLMRRLPQKYELLKRCISMPLITILISILLACLLLVVYYVIYLWVTPDICLSPHQWQKIWIRH